MVFLKGIICCGLGRKKISVILVLSVLFTLTLNIWFFFAGKRFENNDEDTSEIFLAHKNEYKPLVSLTILRELNEEQLSLGDAVQSKGCEAPILNPFDQEVIQHFEVDNDLSLFDFNQDMWDYQRSIYPLYLDPKKNILSFSDFEVKNRKCSKKVGFQKIFFFSDKEPKLGEEVIAEVGKDYEIKDTDFVLVNCYFKNKKKPDVSYHQQVLYNDPKYDVIEDRRNSKEDPKFNIIMIVTDSISRSAYIRSFKKIEEAFKRIEKEKSVVRISFSRFNTIGVGSTNNVLAALTGSLEHELPEAKMGYPNASHVDSWGFIFDDFEKQGYATCYSQSDGGLGNFNYRLRGFSKPPTTHYPRIGFLGYKDYRERYWKRGSEWNTETFFEYSTDMLFSTYQQNSDSKKNRPIFSFQFSDETHSSDLGNKAFDEYFAKLLLKWYGLREKPVFSKDVDESKYGKTYRNIFKSGIYDSDFSENTILVFSGDHGRRSGQIRKTELGRYEELNPMLHFVFPEIFSTHPKFKKLADQMRNNKDRLVTGFDIYATFQNLLDHDFENKYEPRNKKFLSKRSRSTSLFENISETRNCVDAGIRPRFCRCSVSVRIENVTRSIYVLGVKKILEFANKEIADVGENKKCEELKLRKILSVQIQIPEETAVVEVESFKGAGYDRRRYIVKFEFTTESGYIGILEGVFNIYHDTIHPMKMKSKNVFLNGQRDIQFSSENIVSRIDKYGDRLTCSPNTYIEKFCSCKK